MIEEDRMTDIRQSIQHQIAVLEEAFGMEVLYACDYGSRAWGLETAASDFDIRLIYRDPPERAFSLFNDRETIRKEVTLLDAAGLEVPVEFSGWCLPKAFKLAQVSNPQILEIMGSPHRYMADETLTGSLEEITPLFSPRTMGHYHRGIGKKNYLGKMVNSSPMDVKASIQAVRSLMSARWIVRTNGEETPPLRFNDLLEGSVEHWSKWDRQNVLPQIQELVSLKVEMGWRTTRRYYPSMMNWCMGEIAALDRDVLLVPDTPVEGEVVEKAFRKQYPDAFGLTTRQEGMEPS